MRFEARNRIFGEDAWPVAEGLAEPATGQANTMMLLSADADGAWQSALSSVLDDGECLLVVGMDETATAVAAAARRLGIEVLTVTGETQPARLGALASALENDRHDTIRAVFVTDYAGAAESPVAAVRAVLDRCLHDALLLADLGKAPRAPGTDLDRLGIDIAIVAGTRTGMVPNGMTAIALGRAAENAAAKRWYAGNTGPGASIAAE